MSNDSKVEKLFNLGLEGPMIAAILLTIGDADEVARRFDGERENLMTIISRLQTENTRLKALVAMGLIVVPDTVISEIRLRLAEIENAITGEKPNDPT